MKEILYVLVVCLLIYLSIKDIKTHEIPLWVNASLLVIGLIHTGLNYTHFLDYFIGFFAVSLPLFLILYFTKGKGIGGGDVKLMAVCGLILGWKQIILAFVIACILGAIIHIMLMIFLKLGRELAFGPYLSMGVVIALVYGEELINWYINCVIGVGVIH